MSFFRSSFICLLVSLAMCACGNGSKQTPADDAALDIAVYEVLAQGGDSLLSTRDDIAKAELANNDVIYYLKPALMAETVKPESVEYKPEFDGRAIVSFRFADREGWARATGCNIGNRLALEVNGKIVHAVMVLDKIMNRRCSVFLTEEEVKEFLPGTDAEKLFHQ